MSMGVVSATPIWPKGVARPTYIQSQYFFIFFWESFCLIEKKNLDNFFFCFLLALGHCHFLGDINTLGVH
jgi:hypothetical protein